jgi:hypothetical protein
MAEIVNLNRFRKKKARAAGVREAEENRIKHGRTKSEKQRITKEAERDARTHEGKKFEDEN